MKEFIYYFLVTAVGFALCWHFVSNTEETKQIKKRLEQVREERLKKKQDADANK